MDESRDDLRVRIARTSDAADASRTSRSDTRVRLIAAALELFAKNGFDATTMRDLAAFVGIKAPAIYNHFPSKEAVLSEALLWVMQDFNGALLGPDESQNGDAVVRLRGILSRHAVYHIANPLIVRAFEVLSASDLLARLGAEAERAAVVDQLRLYVRTVGALVGEILERQDLPRPNTRIVTHAITTMYDQIGRWYVSRSPAQDAELIETYWALVRSMLRLD